MHLAADAAPICTLKLEGELVALRSLPKPEPVWWMASAQPGSLDWQTFKVP
jgi:hypothetical protein